MEVAYVSSGLDFSDLDVGGCCVVVGGLHSTTGLVASFCLVDFERLLKFSLAIGIVGFLWLVIVCFLFLEGKLE